MYVCMYVCIYTYICIYMYIYSTDKYKLCEIKLTHLNYY